MNDPSSPNYVTPGAPPVTLNEVGSALQLAPTAEAPDPDMAMPIDQQAAWLLVDGFRSNYLKRHGHQPRRGQLMKYFKKALTKVRARMTQRDLRGGL